VDGVSESNQYHEDCGRLAMLIERHTGIPHKRTSAFLGEYGTEQIIPCANLLCKTAAQRDKLTALFEFKNVYETIKQGTSNKEYCLDSPDSAKAYFIDYFADKMDREYVAAAYLNFKHNVITSKTIYSGTLNTSLIDPREIIKEALFCNANGIIIAHNHPSGNTEPSVDDEKATMRIHDGASAAGVHLLDHIIVGGDNAISLTDAGVFQKHTSRQDISRAASSTKEKPPQYIRKLPEKR
jgi:DNA repair protein RadC